MKFNKYISILFCWVLLISITPLVAQEKSLNKEHWQEAVKDVEFSETPKEPKKEEPKKQKSAPNDSFDFKEFFQSLELPFKIIGYVLLVAIVALVLWKLLPFIDTKNKKIQSIQQINSNPDLLENHMKSLDFEALIQEALKNENSSLAIRLYYLRILKTLWDKRFIKWRKPKTNSEYLLETAQQPFYAQFLELTKAFDKSWYGEKPTFLSDFENYQQKAQQFLNQLNG